MADEAFRALVAARSDSGMQLTVTSRRTADLPAGELLIRVHYSSLNYKDALSASGRPGITRHYPHTPGIDAAGTVEQSDHADFAPGQEVLVTGFDLGMNTPGGFGQRIRVPAVWALPLPEGLSLRQSMVLGTAGLTAGLAVQALIERGIRSDNGPVLISGASGGVGSAALLLLRRLGYEVTAVNGRRDRSDDLRRLGATAILPVEEASDTSGRPLLGGRWAGAIDSLGGTVLATTLKALLPGATAVACGNALANDLPTTVLPFILNGIALVGIDSATCPLDRRQQVWNFLAATGIADALAPYTRTLPLEELPAAIDQMLDGSAPTGRTLVDLTSS